jgi:Fur family transcriptional regulator, zinc uptake regulator
MSDYSAEQYTQRAIAVLKQNGYRITEPRRHVIDILATATAPLAAYDIKSRLEAVNAQADVTSVYRILECLEKNHLLHKTFQQGKVFRCELEDAHGCEGHDHHGEMSVHEACHHFMSCRQCGRIQEIHCYGLERIASDLLEQHGFRAETHLLQITGLCQACQA